MKLFRNLAKSLYETFVPAADRQTDAAANISDADRAKLAITYFSREAALLPSGHYCTWMQSVHR